MPFWPGGYEAITSLSSETASASGLSYLKGSTSQSVDPESALNKSASSKVSAEEEKQCGLPSMHYFKPFLPRGPRSIGFGPGVRGDLYLSSSSSGGRRLSNAMACRVGCVVAINASAEESTARRGASVNGDRMCSASEELAAEVRL